MRDRIARRVEQQAGLGFKEKVWLTLEEESSNAIWDQSSTQSLQLELQYMVALEHIMLQRNPLLAASVYQTYRINAM